MIEKHIHRIVIIVALLFSVVTLVIFPRWTADDAYIIYRYSENLVHHGQLTYNVGEPPVEGYTGVVLPIVLAGAIKLGLNPDLVTKAIGVLSYYLGCFLLILIVRRLRFHKIIELLCVVLYLTLPMYYTHVYAGLETMLFSCVLTAALLYLIRVLNPGPRPGRDEILLWLLLLLACLVRPEGVAMAGLSGIALFWYRWSVDRRTVPALAVHGLFFLALPLGAYILWKLSYYGHVLPNSYYAKALEATNRFSVGWMKDFWHRYVSFIATAGALVWLTPVANWIRRPSSLRPSRLLLENLWVTVVLIFAAVSVYQYSRTHLSMNYGYRFFVPFYVPLLVSIAHMANRGIERLCSSRYRGRHLLILIAAVLSTIQVYRHLEHLPGEYRFTERYSRLMQEALIPAGKALRGSVPPEEWLAVCIDAGAMPFYSGLRTVDLGRLNDPVLARDHHTDSETVDYAFAHNPGAWVITSRSRNSLVKEPLTSVLASDSRLEGYTRAADFYTPARPDYIEVVYIRNDLMPAWRAARRESQQTASPGQ